MSRAVDADVMVACFEELGLNGQHYVDSGELEDWLNMNEIKWDPPSGNHIARAEREEFRRGPVLRRFIKWHVKGRRRCKVGWSLAKTKEPPPPGWRRHKDSP